MNTYLIRLVNGDIKIVKADNFVLATDKVAGNVAKVTQIAGEYHYVKI
jgi:hypothetical protein